MKAKESVQKIVMSPFSTAVIATVLSFVYIVSFYFAPDINSTAQVNNTSLFKDILGGTYDAIVTRDLRERGVIEGYADGSFKPSGQLTRAELSKFLVEGSDMPSLHNSAKENLSFPDIVRGQWYVPYVETVRSTGVVRGYDDGTFRPERSVSRAEFVKMVSITFGLDKGVEYSYIDVPANVWFAKYAGWFEQQGIFYDSLMRPEQPVTRLETARAIYAAIQLNEYRSRIAEIERNNAILMEKMYGSAPEKPSNFDIDDTGNIESEDDFDFNSFDEFSDEDDEDEDDFEDDNGGDDGSDEDEDNEDEEEDEDEDEDEFEDFDFDDDEDDEDEDEFEDENGGDDGSDEDEDDEDEEEDEEDEEDEEEDKEEDEDEDNDEDESGDEEEFDDDEFDFDFDDDFEDEDFDFDDEF